MNRFPPGPPGPPGYRQPAPPQYAAPPPGYGAPPPGYGLPGYGQQRPPQALIPPSGTEAAVASVVFALIGQSEKRIEAHALEMEKFGAGLQHLGMECTETLNAIRPDTQRAYLFDSFLQDVRGHAEEIRRSELDQKIQQERVLQAALQRLLDEGLPMISGALDPNQGLPRGFEPPVGDREARHQPPQRHVIAAPVQRRPQSDREDPRRVAPVTPLRRRPGPVQGEGRSAGPGPAMTGPRAPVGDPRGVPMPTPSAFAAYGTAFKRKAAQPVSRETGNSSKPVNGAAGAPSAPSVAAPVEHDESDSTP